MIKAPFFHVMLLATSLVAAPLGAQTPHGGHPQPAPPEQAQQQPQPKPPVDDHSGHAMPPAQPTQQLPKEPIPPITDADRAAAFPPIPEGEQGHTVHDRTITTFVLFERLEWQGAGDGGGTFENTSWIGGDIDRLWIRGEAETGEGDLEEASVHGLWGHSFSRWWDFVAGVRQDFRPGDPQTWAAIGIQGLAPQWFEIEATGYVGAGGRTHARLEAEYDLLLTNRLVLQPLVELDLYGKDDPGRGIGAGLSSMEIGLRLRYEIWRELAPYIGVVWDRKLFGTADFARDEGEDVGGAKLAFGLRTWF